MLISVAHAVPCPPTTGQFLPYCRSTGNLTGVVPGEANPALGVIRTDLAEAGNAGLPPYQATTDIRPSRRDRGVVNVLDLGAHCDGTTDDTEAFHAAFAAALARPTGSAILVPAGRCLVSAPLVVGIDGNRSIRLRGEGRDVSEIVWSGNTDGLRVTLTGTHWWLRTPANSAPVFHVDSLSFVSAGPGIGGTALAITSDAVSNEASGGGLAPMVELHDIGVHGTVNGGQGWHDGVAVKNLPSGLRWDDGYVMLANGPPPFLKVGNGISIRGGAEDAKGCVKMVSSLYFLSRITLGATNHGVDIGSGVQDVNMDRVSGGGNWHTWAYQRAGCGQTATIRISNSNTVGYYGAVHIENIDTVFLTANEPQASQDGTNSPWHTWNGFDFVGSIPGSGTPGSISVIGNKILGSTSHGGQPWVGISINKVFDVAGAFNPTVISGNLISLVDIPVQAINQARNVLVTGNAIDNFARGPVLFTVPAGNLDDGNMVNGRRQDIPATDPHVLGQLYHDSAGVVHRSGG